MINAIIIPIISHGGKADPKILISFLILLNIISIPIIIFGFLKWFTTKNKTKESLSDYFDNRGYLFLNFCLFSIINLMALLVYLTVFISSLI